MFAKYFAVWFLLAVVAVANGTIRQFTYGKFVSDLSAHQISTFTAILASWLVAWIASRVWPIESLSQAWSIGFCWLAMTIVFEFGFGHFVAGHSWQRLLADYNLFNGRVWLFFLLWLTILPFVVFKLTSRGA